MSDTGFTKKLIELTITLGVGDFGADLGDTVTISGLRMTAEVTKPGGPSMGAANVRVYGLPFEMMNKLTTIGVINNATRVKNTILIAAGDAETGMQNIFQGVIFEAFGDYNAAPDVAFNVIAYANYEAALKPVGALSYEGSTDVGGILQTISNEMGLIFENNGVDVKLSNPYLPGTNLDRVRALATAADFRYSMDRQVLAIWPRNGERKGEKPIISAETGMIGYPSFSSKGMNIRLTFNWNLNLGETIVVQSELPMACGEWNLHAVSHSIATEMPDGPWFTNIEVYRVF